MKKLIDLFRLKSTLGEVALFVVVPASLVESVHFDFLVKLD
jgi:hypothetical protein